MTAVPIRLRRNIAASVRADAYFLPAARAEDIARIVQFNPSAKSPVMYRAGEGVLVVSQALSSLDYHGAIRLKAVSEYTFIPLDSELVPPFLPDELTALTRANGLIILPGGRVFSFDWTHPITTGEWLSPANVRRLDWQ